MTLGLIGFSGTGKSSLAKIFSKNGFKVLDTDSVIETNSKMSIDLIFKTFGESYFRNLENSLLENLEIEKYDLIAFGGGINAKRQIWKTIRKSKIFICFLSEDFDILFERVANKRPLLRQMSKKEVFDFMKKRKLEYLKDCDFIFEEKQKPIEKLFQELKVFI